MNGVAAGLPGIKGHKDIVSARHVYSVISCSPEEVVDPQEPRDDEVEEEAVERGEPKDAGDSPREDRERCSGKVERLVVLHDVPRVERVQGRAVGGRRRRDARGGRGGHTGTGGGRRRRHGGGLKSTKSCRFNSVIG